MPQSNQQNQKIKAMRQGGKALADVKSRLRQMVKGGTKFEEIEALVQKLIKQAGMQVSFSTVGDYDWATCITKNSGLCHGIPRNQVVNEGDIITIDVGLISQGYHLDSALTVAVGRVSKKINDFLAVGQAALALAIAQARPGKTVFDISRAMDKRVQKAGFRAVYQLTGHGLGHKLHQPPVIPCVAQPRDKKIILKVGQTMAIEMMYAMGDAHLKLADDGWTYITSDGSLTAMFEESVLITKQGPEILTLEKS
ncbi:type I methionyl aminopeptidase [Patescibacteria group bacterium]|nr:type I methionyl aminopeptidase [Patescibacteria group bacterium]